MSADSTEAPTEEKVFRLSWLAYLIVLFLAIGVLPLALAHDLSSGGGAITFGPRAVLLLIPVLAAGYIARTATLVDGDGLRVRALFGSRRWPWSQVRGLTIDGRSVYAVVDGGAVRLPCVHVANLAQLATASAGSLPEIAEPTPKYAPRRHR